MPLHHNASASQKTLSLKSEEVFVKENYMLSRERVTCFTQVINPKIELKPGFVFKGKCTRTHLTLQKMYIVNELQKYLTELSRF